MRNRGVQIRQDTVNSKREREKERERREERERERGRELREARVRYEGAYTQRDGKRVLTTREGMRERHR
eukprot:1380736-Amorphochlora_amoeboformis.AAC.1